MPGLLGKLKEFGKECVAIAKTEYRKAKEEAERQKAQAAPVQAAQNLGQQMPTQQYPQQPPNATGITPAQYAALQSRIRHMQGLHTQASHISTSRPVVDHRYPEGDWRRYGR